MHLISKGKKREDWDWKRWKKEDWELEDLEKIRGQFLLPSFHFSTLPVFSLFPFGG
jgi:hypothetical protein